MKALLTTLLTAALLTATGCQKEQKVQETPQDTIPAKQVEATKTPTSRAASEDCAVARAFLEYYAARYEHIYSEDFVNYEGNFRIDFAKADAFMKRLEMPKYFSPRFIAGFKQNLRKIDNNLKVSPQDDGPVDGLEHDLFLLTQEPDEMLALIKSGRVKYRAGNNSCIADFGDYGTITYSCAGGKIDAVKH